MDASYFQALYAEGRVISDVKLRVDGRLVTEVSSRSGMNRTRLVTYHCWPLLLGVNPGGERDDVLCAEKNLDSQSAA